LGSVSGLAGLVLLRRRKRDQSPAARLAAKSVSKLPRSSDSD